MESPRLDGIRLERQKTESPRLFKSKLRLEGRKPDKAKHAGRRAEHGPPADADPPGQRLDKWIWCARLAKTRSLASDLIAAGKVRINGERIRKASRKVRPGDVLTGVSQGRLWVVRVLDASDRRVPASLTGELYQDLTPAGQANAAPAGAC